MAHKRTESKSKMKPSSVRMPKEVTAQNTKLQKGLPRVAVRENLRNTAATLHGKNLMSDRQKSYTAPSPRKMMQKPKNISTRVRSRIKVKF